ncbi:MAG: malonyl-ACP O-methyltransferase BioC [Gammaproteobacteria bacterium]|nr:MAG: malonyl-ACP O-methyltransferase BioC [Gammaproteobacteria bacterium]
MNDGPTRTPRGPTVAAHDLDTARVRRLAARAAPHYDKAAWLPRQVADALMEHLQPVRIQPARILDVGAGTGICSQLLSRRYRSARVTLVDCSMPMLRAARGRGPRWFSKCAFACGDGESLPVADGSIDLLVSSLMLPSCTSPDPVLAEFQRVLKPGGLLMFSSLGPDTLRELRESWLAVDPDVHVHAFLDMHDLGDALLRAGLRDVVMDTERITGRYRDAATLMGELKRLGVSNAARGCRAGLTTSALVEAMVSQYERHRRDATLPASFEVVFGHAWRAPPRSVDVSLATPGTPRTAGTDFKSVP